MPQLFHQLKLRRSAGFLPAAVLLLSLAFFPACQMPPAGGNGGGSAPLSNPAALITFCADGPDGCSPAGSFSVAALRDLVITVNWSGVAPGNHAQTLELLLPGGGLLQSMKTGFKIPAGSNGSFSAVRVLPVAGTWISQKQETGNWSVQVALDGKPVASQSLELNP
ncbi:MAG: hypothetical protein WA737_08295 [Candidatus Acidiferrales bacterium]